MEKVIVERTFEEPVEFDDLQAMEGRFSWCLEQHRIKFLRSYFSSDRKRMICVYEAPDAEAVRTANRTADLPFDRIWTASVHGPCP
jgi:hypothetical protein